MKIFIGIALFSLVMAEPPPSHSYLPPSPSGSRNGYPENHFGNNYDTAPEVLAARGLRTNEGHSHHHTHGANTAIGTSNTHDIHSAHGASGDVHDHELSSTSIHYSHGGYSSNNHDSQGEGGNDQSSSNSFGKNLLNSVNEPVRYNFGYMVNDYQEGTEFGHHEERLEERAQGEYHVVLPDGRKQTVNYEADERGFKPQVTYKQSEEARGYGNNANNLPKNGYHTNGDDHRSDGNHGYHDNARSGSY